MVQWFNCGLKTFRGNWKHVEYSRKVLSLACERQSSRDLTQSRLSKTMSKSGVCNSDSCDWVYGYSKDRGGIKPYNSTTERFRDIYVISDLRLGITSILIYHGWHKFFDSVASSTRWCVFTFSWLDLHPSFIDTHTTQNTSCDDNCPTSLWIHSSHEVSLNNFCSQSWDLS